MGHMCRYAVRSGAMALAAFCGTSAGGSLAISEDGKPFPRASVHFEQNATDGDVEVVFRAKGGDDGLASLQVVSPDGRTVVSFTAPDASTLGIRQFDFESPEPSDVASLKAAYPEGVYAFTGSSFSGARFVGESTLSHQLPATVEFASPVPEAEGVPINNTQISWRSVPGVKSYIIELEQDELETKVEAVVPGSAGSFAVPDGFLLPGTEYQLGIATVSQEGNVSFVETSFTTAE